MANAPLPDSPNTERMRISHAAICLLACYQPVHAITIELISYGMPSCVAPDGYLNVMVTGGTPPYTYSWDNGATTQNISGLAPGYYELTVMDAVFATATQGWNLNVVPLYSPPSAQDGHSSCIGSMSGRVQVIEFGINGTPPYSYSPLPSGSDPQGDPYFEVSGVSPGDPVQIQVTDAFGCTGILTQYLMAPQLFGGPQMTVSSVQGSCSTGAGGTAVIGNVYDGGYFGGPDYALLDASENYVSGGVNAANTINFNGLPPGDYHMVRDWDPSGVYMAYNCDGNPYDRIEFTIPDLGPDCGAVSGTTYIDFDGDCTQDANDLPVPYQVLAIDPGPQYTITGGDGSYSIDLVDGSYTLAQTDPTLVQLCPASDPVPFTIASNQIAIHFASSSSVPLDVAADLESGAMRPGFYGTYWGQVRNLSPQLTGAVTATLALDPVLVYQSAWPVPSSVVSNILTWNLPALAPLSGYSFSVQVLVPAGTTIGTPLSTTLNASCVAMEGDLANNTAAVALLVTGSYDPNDKVGTADASGSTSQFFIDQDEWIDYVVRFQNTGTDTAFTVVITDTLAAELDMASFQQGLASHAFEVEFKPGRVVEWTFSDILLPDSNVNEPASHGLVKFRIKPVQPVLAGSVTENVANIYFDFNDPVITDPSVLVAEFSTGVDEAADGRINVHPNPTSDQVRITVPSDATRTYRVFGADGRDVQPPGVWSDDLLLLDAAHLAPGFYLIHFGKHTARFLKH